MTGFDLPTRLRQIAEPGFPGVMGYSAARDIRLAADRIETLEAEVDRLTVDNQRLGSRFTGDDATDLKLLYTYEAGLADGRAEQGTDPLAVKKEPGMNPPTNKENQQ